MDKSLTQGKQAFQFSELFVKRLLEKCFNFIGPKLRTNKKRSLLSFVKKKTDSFISLKTRQFRQGYEFYPKFYPYLFFFIYLLLHLILRTIRETSGFLLSHRYSSYK